MNITIQKFNAVVEGHNVHRQLMHDQINEQIHEIVRLNNTLQECTSHQARLAEHANQSLNRAANAEEFIRLATQVARGEGVSTVIAVPGGSDLMVEILRLRQAASNAELILEQERAAAKQQKRVRRKKA